MKRIYDRIAGHAKFHFYPQYAETLCECGDVATHARTSRSIITFCDSENARYERWLKERAEAK